MSSAIGTATLPTASLLEKWIDEAERRIWFLGKITRGS